MLNSTHRIGIGIKITASQHNRNFYDCKLPKCYEEAVLLSLSANKNRKRDKSQPQRSITTIYRQSRNNVLLSRLFPSETFPKMLSEWHVVDKQTKELAFLHTAHIFQQQQQQQWPRPNWNFVGVWFNQPLNLWRLIFFIFIEIKTTYASAKSRSLHLFRCRRVQNRIVFGPDGQNALSMCCCNLYKFQKVIIP